MYLRISSEINKMSMTDITHRELMNIISTVSKLANVPVRRALNEISDIMPVRATDTRGRASSSNNAIAKDWARIGGQKWTAEDEKIRRGIFRGILFSNKCDYCGKNLLKSNRERDHVVPSSARKDGLYGTDNDGNKFNVCRACNDYKKHFHPSIIIEKMRQDRDYRRANAFERFLNIFESKLTLRPEIVRKIQYYQSKMDQMTKQFCDEMEREMKNSTR